MSKGTLAAAAIFLALIVAAFFSLRQPAERGVSRLSFAGFDKEKVSQLTITGSNPVELKKTDGRWLVSDGKPADENAIKAALEAIARIDSSDVATTHSDRFAALEVDDAKGLHVVAWNGPKHAAEFTLGKAAAGGAHVRSGDTVFLVKGIYPGTFSKPAAQWHRLKLFQDSIDDVSKVEVALAGGAPYALVKKDSAWGLEDSKAVPEGFRFDADAARSLVTALINLTAKEMLDKDPGEGTTQLADTLAFTGKDNVRHEVKLGAAQADHSVYAKVSGGDDVYALNEFSAKGLRKNATDLRQLTIFKVEPEKAKAIAITSGKNTLTLKKGDGGWAVDKSSEKAPADFQFEPSQGAARLSSLNSARALRLATPDEVKAAPLAHPSASVVVTLEDRKELKLVFGGEGKEGAAPIVFARGNIDGELYVVSKGLADRLTGGLTTFKAPQQPMFDASQLANLPPEVRAQLLQQMQQRAAQGGAH